MLELFHGALEAESLLEILIVILFDNSVSIGGAIFIPDFIMRNIAIAALLLMLTFFLAQIHSLYKETASASAVYDEEKQNLFRAQEDAKKSSSDLNYLLNPINLEKELRARFNYKLPDENLIIIVPKVTSSTP